MTDRLYYRDATRRTFTGRIVEVSDDGRKVYLEQTAFYPTSGGQPHDLGTLNGQRVLDVVDEGERVLHVLEAPIAATAGTDVHGEIDWPLRSDHMQQHTGQHLLSAVIEDLLGLRTVSVHFGPETSTLDVADATGGARILETDTLERVESRANSIVAEARPVTVTFEDAASVTGLRKATDRDGLLRVVTIEGVDRSACGGTHVASTAQIGPVLLRRQERVKQGLRIEFVCGGRALRRARHDLELLSRVARTFSASIDDVPGLVEAQASQVADLTAESRRLTEKLAAYRAAELHAAAIPKVDGLRVVVERVSSGADAARTLALAMGALPHVLFVAVSHSPPSILVATSDDSGLEAGKLLKPLLEKVGGRGGGSARLAQGSAPSAEAVDQVLTWLAS